MRKGKGEPKYRLTKGLAVIPVNPMERAGSAPPRLGGQSLAVGGTKVRVREVYLAFSNTTESQPPTGDVTSVESRATALTSAQRRAEVPIPSEMSIGRQTASVATRPTAKMAREVKENRETEKTKEEHVPNKIPQGTQ